MITKKMVELWASVTVLNFKIPSSDLDFSLIHRGVSPEIRHVSNGRTDKELFI